MGLMYLEEEEAKGTLLWSKGMSMIPNMAENQLPEIKVLYENGSEC